jgi:EAL and modified HD-GYP domain-containing signal transduction protein
MTGEDSSLHDIFVGRQPIYDAGLNVVAYELLFRAGRHETADVQDADHATTQVILNTFMEIGLERIVGTAPAFFNLTREFVVGGLPFPAAPEQVGLEILEDIDIDDELIQGTRKLAERGYTILLDDFVYHESLRPLVDLADIVKIDVLALGREETARHVEILREYDVKLLAEKVETQEEFEYYQALGFEYYQGFFFCRPKVVSGRRIPINKLAVLQLLAKVQDPRVEFEELEDLISQDVSLSFRMLKLINSAQFALRKKVESLRQALVILGLRAIRNWISLLALAKVEGKPNELLVVALIRGKMCELLARAGGRRDAETFFTVGLFSVLDAMLDQPLVEVVASLPLAEEINQGLLRHQGPHGNALACAIAYERGDWAHTQCMGVSEHDIQSAYLEALDWADNVKGAIS